jgi:hypothetical protein
MAKRKTVRKVVRKKVDSTLHTVLLVICSVLIFDGMLRILFAVFPFSGPTFSFMRHFTVRWLLIGLTEIICAYGLHAMKKWALFVLFVLSLFRIYTIFMYVPEGLFPPLQNNAVFYICKIISVVLLLYLFTKRKLFK